METILENRPLKIFGVRNTNYVLPAIAVILAICLLKDYFVPGIQIALGIMVAPFVFKVKKYEFSYRYAYAFGFFLLAYYFLQIYVLLFLSVGCLIFFTIECQSGKIGLLPFLLLICVSPAMYYIVNVFTFSIRLELSRYSAMLLNTVGMAVENRGSFFIMPDGSTFSVDTACIGLNMFNTGLIVSLLLIGLSEQRTKKDFGFFHLILIFLVTVACLMATNLLRIVGLVFFKSAPGTIQHDLMGMASLILYTVIPVYFLISFIQKRNRKPIAPEALAVRPSFKKNVSITLLLAVAVVAVSFKVKDHLSHTIKDQKLSELNLPGFTKQTKEDGVAEFRQDSILIYIKPSVSGYESDHPPSMCWQGSGFKLENVSEEVFSGYTLLSAVLKRGDVVQYTAWWYDNGTHKTIDQLDWRFSKGEPYRIINITTKSKAELDSLCAVYITKKLF
ncbi:MAG: exosortase N [Bacteroidota bacterium]